MKLIEEIHSIIESKEPLIETVNRKVWEFAELGFKEFQSVELYSKLLEDEGFHVKHGLAGMPTAFEASFGNGSPTIGILAEYDALPNLSQKAGVSTKLEEVKGGNGHGCGHNSLGAGSFAAAISLKEYMLKHNIAATIKLFGCPSEEKGNSKTFMAREGCFDNLDAVFTWHPGDGNYMWSFRTLANLAVTFTFKGTTAHAAANPHLGRSALDTVEIMNIGVNYLREHIVPEARVHYAYLDAGGTAPNVVQDRASIKYYIRAPKISQVLDIFERVKDIAKGSALISGTEGNFEITAGLSDFIPNATLSKVLHDSMTEYGVPEFDASDFALAREFFNTLSDTKKLSIESKLVKKLGKEKAIKSLENPLDIDIAPLRMISTAVPGSTDVGDVSYVVPTAQLSMATACIGTDVHTWQMTAQGNTSIAMKGLKAAAGAIVLSVLKVIEDPKLLLQAREELISETGGKYNCPIPSEIKPRLED